MPHLIYGTRPHRLTWLGIDFFNTLWGIGPVDGPKITHQVLEDFGYPRDINAIWPEYRELELLDLTGQIDTNERYAKLLNSLGIPALEALISALRAAEKHSLSSGEGVLEGAVEFLEWAGSQGIRRFLVSNVTEIGTEVQAESGLLDHIDHMATSRNLHAVKSHRKGYISLFMALQAEYDVPPETGAIIDDEERWLKQAHMAGMVPTILLTQAWEPWRVLDDKLSFSPGMVVSNLGTLQERLTSVLTSK